MLSQNYSSMHRWKVRQKMCTIYIKIIASSWLGLGLYYVEFFYRLESICLVKMKKSLNPNFLCNLIIKKITNKQI